MCGLFLTHLTSCHSVFPRPSLFPASQLTTFQTSSLQQILSSCLAKHLLIIAPLSDTEYFMHSLLQMTSPDELVQKPPAPSSSVAQLLIYFQAGCAQNGVFCALVVYLLSKYHWEFAKGNLECVSRRCVCYWLPDTPVTIA